MGFFQAGVNKKIAGAYDPINQGFQANVGDLGAQAAGNTDRATQLYGDQGSLYSKIGNMLQSGGFDTPGQFIDKSKQRAFYESMQGLKGSSPLTTNASKAIRSYGDIAAEGYRSPQEQQAYEYALRERPASQARSLTSSFMDEMRRQGVSGWGGGNPAANLAAQKNLLSSLREGNYGAERDIGTDRIEAMKYGNEGLERMQQGINANQDIRTAGHKAGLGDYLSYLNADPRGSALDWAKMANSNLGGAQSGLSGWGSNVNNQMGMSKEQSGLQTTLGAIGTIGKTVGSVAGAL